MTARSCCQVILIALFSLSLNFLPLFSCFFFSPDLLVRLWWTGLHCDRGVLLHPALPGRKSHFLPREQWRSDRGWNWRCFWGSCVDVDAFTSFVKAYCSFLCVCLWKCELINLYSQISQNSGMLHLRNIFELLWHIQVQGEIQEIVKTGLWVGDCFIYTSSVNRLNYYVGGEIVTIAHLDR